MKQPQPRKRAHSLTALGALLLCLNIAGTSLAATIDVRSTVFVTNRDSSDITMIDTKSDRIVGKIPLGQMVNAHMAMVTPDGKKLLVAGTKANQALLVDLASLQVSKRIPVGVEPEHFDISPDGKLALMGNLEEGTVSVLDLAGGKEIKRLDGFAEPHGVAFLSQHKVYVSSIGAHEVAAVSVDKLEVTNRMAVGSSHLLASVDPDRYLTEIKGVVNPTPTLDGRFIYSADGDSGEVAIMDTATDSVIKTLRVGSEPWRAYPTPDGTKMLVPNNGDETISVIDTAKQAVVATMRGGPGMTGINFDGTGKKAYAFSTGEYATILIYDLANMREAGQKRLGANMSLETATTTPDGKKIYLASSKDNSVYVIDTATDAIKRIANVGQSPWATTMLGSYQYCH
jgi:YVTN family beta-propeller protein